MPNPLEGNDKLKIEKILKIKERWYIVIREGEKIHLKTKEETEQVPILAYLLR